MYVWVKPWIFPSNFHLDTPLFVAVDSSKSKQLISLLLRSGADPSHQNKQGKTAIDLCPNEVRKKKNK